MEMRHQPFLLQGDQPVRHGRHRNRIGLDKLLTESHLFFGEKQSFCWSAENLGHSTHRQATNIPWFHEGSHHDSAGTR
jgi:hypothetical protein